MISRVGFIFKEKAYTTNDRAQRYTALAATASKTPNLSKMERYQLVKGANKKQTSILVVL
jgi:uncharacterized protein YpmB